jgi:hypothetical protein
MANETLWTEFNNRKLGAERAVNDVKGRSIADNIDRIPATYVSGAALSNSNKTLTLTVVDQSTSPSTTSTVALTDTGDANLIEHIYAGSTELQPSSKTVTIPLATYDTATTPVSYTTGLLTGQDKRKLDSIDDQVALSHDGYITIDESSTPGSVIIGLDVHTANYTINT